MKKTSDPGGRTVTIRLEMGRRQLVALLTLGLLALTPGNLVTEQLTLTTYYPSPYGVYEELRSTQNTYLSYSGGNTCVGSTACGTKLTVTGNASVSGNESVGGNQTVGGFQTVGSYLRVTGAIQRSDGNAIRDANGGWVRTYGNSGWYNGTYGGGVYMDSTDVPKVVKVYGGKSFRSDAGLQVGSKGARFLVTSGGKTGIGTTNPQYPLDVNGDMRVTGLIRDGCRWIGYSVGSIRYCYSGWTAIMAANGGGYFYGGGLPINGWMLCCRFQQY